MTGNQNKVATGMAATAQRNTVFISYSHRDSAWRERLEVFLKPLEREGFVQRWDDTRIEPGKHWREEIDQALQSARVAVLLISADFLASDFIAENELPSLLQKHANEGTGILPVIVGPSRFQKTPLAQFQSINPPDRPLIDLSEGEQDAIWVKVTDAIESAFQEPPVAKPDPSPSDEPQPDKTEETPVMPPNPPGQAKIEFCRRLGNSWRELADGLGIPSHEQARFTQGDEGRAIWTWLENRRKLDRLPKALAAIGRADLSEVFSTRPR